MACGILDPHPGIKPTPPALEGAVLTTGPPGMFLTWILEEKSKLFMLNNYPGTGNSVIQITICWVVGFIVR